MKALMYSAVVRVIALTIVVMELVSAGRAAIWFDLKIANYMSVD